ncbi:hypothetical protein B4N84_21270 [Flavobacterium sp. IR1]|nr:hypothetical protein B4N84_21270 [Flavobacterium sp. IR1]
MKKTFFLLTLSLLIISCTTTSIDLETLKFDKPIPEEIKGIKDIQKDDNGAYGLLSYKTESLQNFKFGDVSFSKYNVPNGYDDAYNEIYVHVDNFNQNKYLGFTISITNDNESKALLNYLKKKLGKGEERVTGLKNGIALVWEVKESNQWVLLVQNTANARDNKKYLETELTIVKQGTRVQNSKDLKWLTILESFKGTHSKKI